MTLLSLEAAAFFVVSVFINFYAGLYAQERASNSVTDIILSNIRVYDVDTLFIYGTWFLLFLVIYLFITRPYSIPFALKSISLFVVIRSIFITLTHVGPFPARAIIDPLSMINKFSFGSDLFFSGHTGMPFLLALVFWKEKRLRTIFLIISVAFGIVVLLGHLHYSIDVMSAFFITYSIYHICVYFFPEEQNMFEQNMTRV